MNAPTACEVEYVTAALGDQLFGLPIGRVLDVFAPERLTRVPLAAPEVAGVLNLRGRIVTAIDMRRRLGLAPRGAGEPCMAIGVGRGGEACGLLVDQVGEVLRLPAAGCEPVPAHLDPAWAGVAAGIHRLEDRLMVVLDVDRCLEPQAQTAAA